MLDALRDWTALVGEPPRIYDWCPASARAQGRDTARVQLWQSSHPRWPSAGTVVGYHGSWRAALQAAGFAVDRRPLELPINERVDAAQRLHSTGMRQTAIAAELELHPRTIRRYLHAVPCGCGQGWVVKAQVCQACAQRQAVAVRRDARSAEQVTRAIIEWARLEGAPPAISDWKQGRHAHGRWRREYPRWPSASTATRLFGSWNAAVQSAGFTPQPAAFTREQVIDALHADAAQRGRPPYAREWSQRPMELPGAGTVVQHFGSWSEGLRAAGLRSPQEKNRWGPEHILHAARLDAGQRGRPPRSADWPRSSDAHPSAAIAARHFGTWNKMLAAAGLSTHKRNPPTQQQLTARTREMIAALHSARAKLGEPFGRPAYQALASARGWPHPNAIASHFGSWPAAYRAAGLQRPHRWDDTNDAELLDLLREHATTTGHVPRQADWKHASADRPTSRTITRRFGSWPAALQAAGLGPPPTAKRTSHRA